MAEVTVRDVVKRYGTVQVMHGVNVEIADGEFVVLVGPSGCGKSTLAAHDRRPRGDLRRRDLHRRPGGQRRAAQGPRHRHGVPVLRALPAHDRRREHGLRAQDQGRAQGRDRGQGRPAPPRSSISATCSTAIPKQLSGGQRQRVAMGRAIVRDPAVFLFDEPLSNLDAKLRVAMRVEIKELHQRLGTTIVYVTHDQIEAMTMADKIVVMRDGRVEQVGAPLELYDHPQNTFVAGFIGSPAMNFIKGKVEAPGTFLADGGARLPLPAPPPSPAAPSPTASAPSISTSARAASPPASPCSSPPARRPRSSPGSAPTRSTPWSRTASTCSRATRSRSVSTPTASTSSTAPAAPGSDDHPSTASASSSPAPARASAAPPR